MPAVSKKAISLNRQLGQEAGELMAQLYPTVCFDSDQTLTSVHTWTGKKGEKYVLPQLGGDNWYQTKKGERVRFPHFATIWPHKREISLSSRYLKDNVIADFEYISGLLETLSKKGVRIIIASRQNADVLTEMYNRVGLGRYFSKIYGRELTEETTKGDILKTHEQGTKPNIDHILHIDDTKEECDDVIEAGGTAIHISETGLTAENHKDFMVKLKTKKIYQIICRASGKEEADSVKVQTEALQQAQKTIDKLEESPDMQWLMDEIEAIKQKKQTAKKPAPTVEATHTMSSPPPSKLLNAVTGGEATAKLIHAESLGLP